ncbi:CKLF-like MARVEL transmembrane domain containing 3 L homeolog [Xenopus laevis]|uniref:CKLF-like MARVEL transmembrane domain containing 3 L homeolog n=1 Tax=Xenopus laevis TaxID=8355 RepID=Q5PQA3_XENLA|nr:CKLF-like MARVEL transmembrane domain containing 3 L homeolog [Xenopus laevis]AAH87295.1 LOC495933 protein [Xenopus laevis]
MDEPDHASESRTPAPALRSALIPGKEFLCSRKGQLLLAEWVVSFLTFICYAASTAVGLMTVPLIEFLWALFTFYAYSLKYNEQLKGILWPLLDFIRCVSAAIIYFVVSLVAVSKYTCGASKAAAVFGFIATIIFAIDFYMIFNELTKFLKKEDSTEDPERQKSEDEDSFSDSD